MSLQKFYGIVGAVTVWFALGLVFVLGTIHTIKGFSIAYGV